MKKSFAFFLISVMAIWSLSAQDTLKTEKMIIIKPYSPSVSDAFKPRQNPIIDDSLTTAKRKPDYSIIEVPVASTFEPEKGRAASVESEPLPYLYDNYALLGFGTHTSILAEFYGSLQMENSKSLGIGFQHYSTQGNIDEVRLDDKFYDTELDLNFSAERRYFNWGIDFEAMHKLVNWYGVPGYFSDVVVNNIDPQQTYYGVAVGGNIQYYEGLFERAELSYRRFGDAYGSGENHLQLRPEFGVPIGNVDVSLDLIVDYLNGSFDKHYFSAEELKYANLNLGAHPSLEIRSGNFSVDLGAEVFFAIDAENDHSDFFIFPKVKASYQMADGYFIPYLGADGGLKQNTYHNFVQENPFVSPNLFITPTSNVYDFFVGAKGKFTENLSYNFRADYRHDDNKALFASYPYGFVNTTGEDYQYQNSFGIIYDDLTTLAFHGELTTDINEKLQVRFYADYFSYDIDTQEEAWNLPEYKISLNGNYQITEKWAAGADLYFVGERMERNLVFSDLPPVETLSVVNLDAYFDANLNLAYKINDRFSAFVRGNNLLGNNYERWKNYPVLGIQVFGGVIYQFDW